MTALSVGAQAVDRALALLRAVGERGHDGVSTVELAVRHGLNRTTVHRLLQALARQGFIERADDGRYFLGAELVSVGRVASWRHNVLKGAGSVLPRLSARTGDTVFLSSMAGFDSLCIERQEGDFPIRTQVLWPGQRHPLGIGAGSLAMLAALPDATVAEVIAANEERVRAAYPRYEPEVLRRLVGEARAQGYAVNDGMIVEGSWAVGVAILNADGAPIASLSLSAVESRMGAARRTELAGVLQAEVARLATA